MHRKGLHQQLHPRSTAYHMHARVRLSGGCSEPGARAAVQSLVRLLLTNPRLPPEEREAAEAKVVSACLKIARMDRGAGLHVVLTMLNSSAEQDQWAAATVVTTVLRADSSTHDAFVSLGGIQALVCALGSVSPQVQTRCLESLQHLAASIALGSEYGTLDGNRAPPARVFPAFGLA